MKQSQLTPTALPIKKSLKYILALFVITSIGCGVPKEYKNACSKYKVYFNPKMQSYICKFRDRDLGGYEIFKNGNDYYCKMKVGLNGGDLMYYGQSYPSFETALQAIEVGMYGNMQVDYDDDLKLHYMGEVHDYNIKKKVDVICD